MAHERKTDKKRTSLAAERTNTASQEPNYRRLSIITSLVALVIAFAGGIPGILGLIAFCNKTSARIVFDSDNSRFVPISSDNAQVAGKTALILLRIRIVGTGEKDAHIANVTTSVFYKGKWISGVRLHPKVEQQTDSKGISKKTITVTHKKPPDTTVVTHMAWQEFEPGRYALGYGESTEFSYACYYDIPGKDRYPISKLRVRIYDYLGNSYQTDVETDSLMLEDWEDVVLLAD